MAVVKYGAIVTDIKGKIGGTVFQGGRSGGIIKNKPNVGGKNSRLLESVQDEVRQQKMLNFSLITKSWGFLDDNQRNSWAGLLGVWTFINKFGEVYNGTPYQIFMACSINRLILTNSLLINAPAVQDAFDPGFNINNWSLASGLQITTANALPVEQTVVIAGTFQTTNTKNFGSLSTRIMFVQDFQSAALWNLTTEYGDTFGYIPTLGSFIWVEIWTCIKDYPKKQYLQKYKIEVVA